MNSSPGNRSIHYDAVSFQNKKRGYRVNRERIPKLLFAKVQYQLWWHWKKPRWLSSEFVSWRKDFTLIDWWLFKIHIVCLMLNLEYQWDEDCLVISRFNRSFCCNLHLGLKYCCKISSTKKSYYCPVKFSSLCYLIIECKFLLCPYIKRFKHYTKWLRE